SDTFERVESAFDTFFIPHTVVNHNELSGLQGGAADEYYHLNANDYNARWQSDGTYVYNTFGNVGIGTTSPNHLLTIGKSGDATSTYRLGVYGSIRAAGSIDANQSFDVAETYLIDAQCEQKNNCPETGDVVSAKDGETIEKSSGAYDPRLIGVVSEKPAISIGAWKTSASSRLVALAGRVPVKVSLENGPIEIGDPITSASSNLGVGMKATSAGRVIGIALESLDNNSKNSKCKMENGKEICKILVFINPHWIGNDLSVKIDASGQIVQLGASQIKSELATLGLVISEDGSLEVKEIKAKKVVTEEIEMRDKVTGEIYCTWIENGEWKKIKGECSSFTDSSAGEGTNGGTGGSSTGTGVGNADGGSEEATPTSSPEVALEASTSTAATGTEITFTAAASNFATSSLAFVWNFGDGASVTSETNSISHSYNAAGTYNVSVSAIGDDQKADALLTIEIIENQPDQTEEACDASHLNLCDNETDCAAAGGHWYDDKCNTECQAQTFYLDSDGDNFGDPNNSTSTCEKPTGYVIDNTDCDDNSSTTYPGTTETCDGIDNNCDGQIDEDGICDAND
ncbi:MAG: PKD domain-containing protein, partial [Candidatus Heimdallarchaeota archaeon]